MTQHGVSNETNQGSVTFRFPQPVNMTLVGTSCCYDT